MEKRTVINLSNDTNVIELSTTEDAIISITVGKWEGDDGEEMLLDQSEIEELINALYTIRDIAKKHGGNNAKI